MKDKIKVGRFLVWKVDNELHISESDPDLIQSLRKNACPSEAVYTNDQLESAIRGIDNYYKEWRDPSMNEYRHALFIGANL